MSVYEEGIRPFLLGLDNLEALFVKAEEHAKARSFDVQVLVEARLAPDQYPFGRQVQAACDQAKGAASRLSGREPPAHPDTEKTLDELRARIEKCRAYLRSIPAAEFAGADERRLTLAFLGGKVMIGAEYLRQLALPNFYFHATLAYEILRHNGVPLSKLNYIGQINLLDA